MIYISLFYEFKKVYERLWVIFGTWPTIDNLKLYVRTFDMVKLCRLVGLKNVFYFKYGPDVPLKGHLDKK